MNCVREWTTLGSPHKLRWPDEGCYGIQGKKRAVYDELSIPEWAVGHLTNIFHMQVKDTIKPLLHPSHTIGGTSCSYRFCSVAELPLRIPYIFQDLVYLFTLQVVCPVVVRIG